MRNRILLTSLACGLLAVAALASAARAEEVRTTHTTKVLKRPGEQAPVVIRVSAGHEMTVLAEQGRWLKVRVEGRTGWVTRTSVESTTEAREVQRNTRRRPFVDGRSLRRGWSGDAPDDRVGEDATGGDDGASASDDRDRDRDGDRASARDEPDDRARRDDGDSDGDAPAARPKKKAAPPKAKARHASDDDEDTASADEGDDEAPRHAKKSHRRASDDDAADDDGDRAKGDDD